MMAKFNAAMSGLIVIFVASSASSIQTTEKNDIDDYEETTTEEQKISRITKKIIDLLQEVLPNNTSGNTEIAKSIAQIFNDTELIRENRFIKNHTAHSDAVLKIGYCREVLEVIRDQPLSIANPQMGEFERPLDQFKNVTASYPDGRKVIFALYDVEDAKDEAVENMNEVLGRFLVEVAEYLYKVDANQFRKQIAFEEVRMRLIW